MASVQGQQGSAADMIWLGLLILGVLMLAGYLVRVIAWLLGWVHDAIGAILHVVREERRDDPHHS